MVKATTSSVSVPETASKAKKATKKETTAPVADAPKVEATEATADKADVSTEINDELAELMKLMQERSSLDTQIKTRVKNIEKKVARMSRLLKNSSKKRKNANSNKVSGFEKPTPISDELAKFVGEPNGTLMARTAISKKIHEYVKSNNLQDSKNRRIIVPDAKLKKLLKTGPNDILSYFNLQRFLKVHFKK
jgi:chromatin remodeling complex protein RSC6